MFRQVRRLLDRPFGNSRSVAALEQKLDDVKALAGKLLAQQVKSSKDCLHIHDPEFKVFSQFGDDGLIQYLVHRVEIPPAARRFVEFGVENYTEANTRFLLINDNWSGLVMDSDPANIEYIRRDPVSWRHDLTAATAFITSENINDLLTENGFAGEIGILSIDIDGNDYWVWKGITAVDPLIVIIEYNSVFGIERAFAVPYDPAFRRTRAHYSNLFWGSSLKALYCLACRKGYAFVGCNSSGNNAYFVRNDKVGMLRPLTPEEGYVESKFRESRDAGGRLTFIRGADRLRVIEDMHVVDLESNRQATIKDIHSWVTPPTS